MGRRSAIILILAVLFMFSMTSVFADVSISKERTTVTNLLPDITIYMDTDQTYDVNKDELQVLVNEKKTDIQSVKPFNKTDQNTNYFILVDISKSLPKDSFEAIKKGVIGFGKKLNKEDKVYLIPFGESVYAENEEMDPTGSDFEAAVKKLELKDNNTQLYTAIDAVVTKAQDDKTSNRNVAIVFTDGIDDTTGGQITSDEAKKGMLEEGIPLYGFAAGKDKAGKDLLGEFCRSVNGSIEDIDAKSIDSKLSDLKNVLDRTLTIQTKVRNSEDIVNEFDVRIQLHGKKDTVVKKGIIAHKSDDSKDVFAVAVKKWILTYWWIIVIAAIALIALIVLLTIKRNKGIVNVDGKIVYANKVQRKYHMQVKEHNTRDLKFAINVNGGKTYLQEVSLVESIIVGRSSMCDVYFDDAKMSRQHFSVELSQGNIYLNDLESTGGTYLNGVRIYTKQKLQRGDTITAGKTNFKVDW